MKSKSRRKVSVTPTKKDYHYQLMVVLTTLITLIVLGLSGCSTSRGVDVSSEEAYFKSLHKNYKKKSSARTARAVPIIKFTTQIKNQ